MRPTGEKPANNKAIEAADSRRPVLSLPLDSSEKQHRAIHGPGAPTLNIFPQCKLR